MNFKDNLSRFIYDYLLITVETVFSVALIGIFFCKGYKVSFGYFFVPPVLGLISMIPCAPMYFMENLTINQIKIYRVVDFVILEFALLGAIYLIFGNNVGRPVYIFAGIFIFINDVLTYIISDYLGRKEADEVNEKLSVLNADIYEDDNESDTI